MDHGQGATGAGDEGGGGVSHVMDDRDAWHGWRKNGTGGGESLFLGFFNLSKDLMSLSKMGYISKSAHTMNHYHSHYNNKTGSQCHLFLRIFIACCSIPYFK